MRTATSIATSIGAPTHLPWSVSTAVGVIATAERRRAAGVRGLAAAIAHAHNDVGLPNPMAHPVARRANRGAQRLAPAPPRKGFPITMRVIKRLHLREIRPVWGALLTAGTAAVARIGDLLPTGRHARPAPQVRDLRLSSQDGLTKLSLRKIARHFTGLRAAMRHLGHGSRLELKRPGSKTSDGPVVLVFRHKLVTKMWSRFIKHRATKPLGPRTPLFSHDGVKAVSRRGFLAAISGCIKQARISVDDQLYSGISMRAGGATALFEAGWPDVLIKAAGRWLSDAYTVYTRIQPATLAMAAASMAT